MEIIAEGRHVRFVREDGWEYAQRRQARGVVAIAAVTDEDKLLLVEQYRVTMKGPVIELPAGLVGDDDPNEEDFAAAARRELLEETGYDAEKLEWLTEGPSSSGLTDEVITFFRARDLKRRGPGGGVEGEAIKVHEIPLKEVHDWLDGKIRAGQAIDPRIYIGLYFV